MWQSLLVYNACPQPQTEATVLVSPSLLQIDTFGKWCRCLHNVCYLKLKKRRYLDKCRLSAPADSTALELREFRNLPVADLHRVRGDLGVHQVVTVQEGEGTGHLINIVVLFLSKIVRKLFQNS